MIQRWDKFKKNGKNSVWERIENDGQYRSLKMPILENTYWGKARKIE